MKDRIVPNRVKEFRKMKRSKHETAVYFAEQVGITRQHLAQIERGEIVPKVSTASRICAVLGEPMETVFPNQ